MQSARMSLLHRDPIDVFQLRFTLDIEAVNVLL